MILHTFLDYVVLSPPYLVQNVTVVAGLTAEIYLVVQYILFCDS